MRKKFGLTLVFLSLVLIVGCETTQSTQEVTANSNLVPLTNDEVLQMVNGRTQFWPNDNGRGFFREDGNFEGHWKGEPAEGTWWVEDAVLCYDVTSWGGEWCYDFFHDGGRIVNLRKGQGGEPRPVKFEDGNQL